MQYTLLKKTMTLSHVWRVIISTFSQIFKMKIRLWSQVGKTIPWIVCLLGLLSYDATAGELPQHCKLMGIKSDKLELKTGGNQLVFIHNISDVDMFLSFVPEADPGAQAGWTSRINQNKWSAISLNKDHLSFECVEVKPGHEQQISCQGVLSVCQIKPEDLPKNITGSFWVSENNNLTKVLQTVSSRGFQLPNNTDEAGDL